MLYRNQSRKILTALLLSILVALLGACSGLRPKEDSIRVNLSSLKILDSTLFEQRFEASVRIQNRSQTELDVKGLSYDLSLNDKDFASGVSNQTIKIAPLSEGVISINLTSTLFSLIRQFKSMQELQSKPFSYDLYGSIYTDNEFFGVSFSEKGEIDLTMPDSRAK
jgi:LEA14-like dessication related protein